MKNPINKNVNLGRTLTLLLVPIYLVFYYLLPFYATLSAGLFFIAVALLNLKKWGGKHFWVISSIFVTYPLLWYLLYYLEFSNAIPNGYELLTPLVLLGVYFLNYLYLLRDVWINVAKESKKLLVSALIVLTLLAVGLSEVTLFCSGVSSAEKGVTKTEISTCKTLNQYYPAAGSFGGRSSSAVLIGLWVPSLFTVGFLLLLARRPKKD